MAVYKIDLNFNMKPFINELMNATGLAFDRAGHAVHFQPLRRHRLPGDAERQHVGLRGGHGRRHRHRVRRRTTICTSATAAARFSRSAPTGRSSSSPRWNLPSRPITWPSVRTAICTSPDPPLRASIRVYRISHDRRSGDVLSRSGPAAGHGLRRRGQAVRGGIDRRTQGRRAHHIRIADAELFLSGPGIVGLAFTPVARAWSWRPPTRSIAWTSASRASFRSLLNERRNHRSRHRRC